MPVVPTLPQLNRVFRFQYFEFSVRAGELRKNGVVVRLQQQPLKVLHALLDCAGEVVTREELRERVWPGESVQDFDNSLRVAVNKLRQALEDDSENPQYIETLPRRGYRWLCPVTVQGTSASGSAQEVVAGSGSIGIIEPKPRNVMGGVPFGTRRVSYKSVVITLVLVAAALIAARFLTPGPTAAELKVVPLTTYPGLEYMPSFSPDGKRVAFAWTGPEATDPYNVYYKVVGDDRPHRLAEAPKGASDSDPVWSPDGKSVYFFRRGAGQTGIYVVPSVGGNAALVVSSSLGNRRVRRSRFALAPDGKELVYPEALPGRETVALFQLDLETKQVRQVSEPPANSEGDGDPAFSHDGKTLAYLRDSLDRQQLLVVAAKGGEPRALVTGFLADFFDGLAWTADDSEILIGGTHLRRLPAGGGANPKAAFDVPGPVLFPAVRGDRLAYVQATLNANIWKLELRDATQVAGEPAKLVSSTRQQAAASFSPDGSRMAFQSDRSGSWEIWTCNRDGSDPVQLTHFGGPMAGTPRWSADGKQIVFDARASGVSQLYVIPAEGGEPRQITHDQAGGDVPYWSRDGKWIYFSSVREGVANLWKQPAEGGTPTSITTHGGIYPSESRDGKYLYFSRSANDATIWRMPIAGGPEEALAGAPKPFDCSHWAVGEAGIYIVNGNGDLLFYQFDNARVTNIFHDQRLVTDWSMALSPDGREVVWAQIDERLADLMLVENFH